MLFLICRMHSECQIRTILSIDDVADYAPLFTDDQTVRIVRNSLNSRVWVQLSIL